MLTLLVTVAAGGLGAVVVFTRQNFGKPTNHRVRQAPALASGNDEPLLPGTDPQKEIESDDDGRGATRGQLGICGPAIDHGWRGDRGGHGHIAQCVRLLARWREPAQRAQRLTQHPAAVAMACAFRCGLVSLLGCQLLLGALDGTYATANAPQLRRHLERLFFSLVV